MPWSTARARAPHPGADAPDPPPYAPTPGAYEYAAFTYEYTPDSPAPALHSPGAPAQAHEWQKTPDHRERPENDRTGPDWTSHGDR